MTRRPGDDITIELKLLAARRTDQVCDRTRGINRLHATLTGIFSALERAAAAVMTVPSRSPTWVN